MDNLTQHELETENKPSGYKVEKLLLLECSFSRLANFESKQGRSIVNKVELTPEGHESSEDNRFAVTLTLYYKGLIEETEICSSTIKMIGIFEKYGEPALSEDKFKAINAPAIIYPFIREHLYNTCLKAGISDILLPTINFKP